MAQWPNLLCQICSLVQGGRTKLEIIIIIIILQTMDEKLLHVHACKQVIDLRALDDDQD